MTYKLVDKKKKNTKLRTNITKIIGISQPKTNSKTISCVKEIKCNSHSGYLVVLRLHTPC